MRETMFAVGFHKNSKLRYLSSSLLFLLSIVAPVSAAFADASIWQGPYIGALTGFAFATNKISTNVGSVTGTSYFSNASDINSVNSSGTFSNHPNAVILGLQGGQDWAHNQMVYGIAMDYSVLPLGSSKSVSNVSYPSGSGQYSESTSMNINWLFTLRGRVGYATTIRQWPSLVYLTTGPAVTQMKVNNSFSDTAASATGGTSTSAYQIGWTAGAGLELLTLKHVSVDLEYLFVYIPKTSANSNIVAGGFGITGNSPYSTTGKFNANIIKLGVNYRF